MEVIREVDNIRLNKGILMADGLFNLTNHYGDVSLWFDFEIKERLMNCSDEEFIIMANKLFYKKFIA